jgi:hypothetical protein
MPLISYVKTATNKRLLISESCADSNRCTPCKGKPDTHDTYAFRASPHTPHVRFLRAIHVHGNLLQAIISIGRTLLLLRKRAPNTTPSPVEWFASPPPSFFPNIAIEAVMKANHLLMNELLRFTRPITPACDWYVQYLLAGTNRSVLNWHSEGYNLEGAGLPYHTPWPSQLTVSIFHLRASSGLRLSKTYQIFQGSSLRNLWPPRGLLTTRPSNVSYLYA